MNTHCRVTAETNVYEIQQMNLDAQPVEHKFMQTEQLRQVKAMFLEVLEPALEMAIIEQDEPLQANEGFQLMLEALYLACDKAGLNNGRDIRLNCNDYEDAKNAAYDIVGELRNA